MDVAVVDPSSYSLPYDHHLCRALAAAGCSVTLYCGQRPFYAWGETTYTVRREFYRRTDDVGDRLPDGMRTALKGIEHVVDSGRLLRRLDAQDPDVVHLQWAPVPLVDWATVAAAGRSRPVVHTVHNAEPLHGGGNPLQRLGARRVRDHADALAAHTEVTIERLRRQGVTTPATRIPHMALTYDDVPGERSYPDAEAGLDIDPSETLLLAFGSLRPYKNPRFAIRTLAALPPDVRATTRLLFVGAPRMSVEPLRALADDLGIADRVEWDLRYVPDALVPAVFRAADVTLLPYTDIDQSGVLLTALGQGTPVVASAVGGFPETIDDGEHGRLHDPADPTAAADAVLDVLSWDTGRTRNAIATLVAERYAPEQVADRTRALYRRLC